MSDKDSPPESHRTGVTQRLRDMEPGGPSELFHNIRITNVSACAATIARGAFRCRTEGRNVRVWKLKLRDEQ
jgi:hypothetical protein